MSIAKLQSQPSGGSRLSPSFLSLRSRSRSQSLRRVVEVAAVDTLAVAARTSEVAAVVGTSEAAAVVVSEPSAVAAVSTAAECGRRSPVAALLPALDLEGDTHAHSQVFSLRGMSRRADLRSAVPAG